MTTPTLKLDLTIADVDMAFVLFQSARQDKYTYEQVNVLMRKIQDQGRPQIEALAVQQNTEAALKKVKEAKARKPRTPKTVQVAAGDKVVDLPDLTDLKLD